MGHSEDIRDSGGGGVTGNGGGSISGGHPPASLLDRIAIATLATITAASGLLGWKLHEQGAAVERLNVQQTREIQRLDELLIDVEGSVAKIPTAQPTPHVNIVQRPGRTIIIISVPTTHRTAEPVPSSSPSPTPSPSPSPSPTARICVSHNPKVCLK